MTNKSASIFSFRLLVNIILIIRNIFFELNILLILIRILQVLYYDSVDTYSTHLKTVFKPLAHNTFTFSFPFSRIVFI